MRDELRRREQVGDEPALAEDNLLPADAHAERRAPHVPRFDVALFDFDVFIGDRAGVEAGNVVTRPEVLAPNMKVVELDETGDVVREIGFHMQFQRRFIARPVGLVVVPAEQR